MDSSVEDPGDLGAYLLKCLFRYSVLRQELHSRIVSFCEKASPGEAAEILKGALESNTDAVLTGYFERRSLSSSKTVEKSNKRYSQNRQSPLNAEFAENNNQYSRYSNKSGGRYGMKSASTADLQTDVTSSLQRTTLEDSPASNVSRINMVATVPLDALSSTPSSNKKPIIAFDICISRDSQRDDDNSPSILASPLYVQNKGKRKNEEYKLRDDTMMLLPGMFLLKNWLTMEQQVKIVLTCQKLGLGTGGFYEPGYGERSKLHLWMMCLGKHWNPGTHSYENVRSEDNATPPPIPQEFFDLVRNALDVASAATKANEQFATEGTLPKMHPDVCLVNFYAESGKLGLHQDKDESIKSIHAGLPIVSFSIGDTAEFLYNDIRNEESAKKVKLESGDVLIFGGKSRMIFHGVSRVFRHTGPPFKLSSESSLRPGRLNLTFRQTDL